MENLPKQWTSLSFLDLRRLEFTIAAELNKLRGHARDLNLAADVTTSIDDALQRIQSNSFAVAVVGEFKRGKSTFINALLGQEILPADIAPTSATLNRVTYGTRPAVRIVFKPENGGEERIETIGIDQLANYVTKLTPEAETMAAKVQEAIVYYPSRFCQNNVSIIDTPGLSDDVTMTDITLSVLPKVDAAILVIMPESPFAGSEGEFLSEHLLHDLGRVFFVVTAIDRIRNATDQERLLGHVTNRIIAAIEKRTTELFGHDTPEYQNYLKQIGKPRIFGLSGYNALHGKMENNSDLIAASGIHAFETALEKFLTEDRGVITLKIAVEHLHVTSITIDTCISERQITVQTQQEAFVANCAAASATLTVFRKIHADEIQAVQVLPERIYSRLQSDLMRVTERINGVAATVIDESTIAYSDLNQASVGAVGSMFGSLVNQVPDDVQSNVRKGWGKLLERLPRNVQDASQDAWKKVAQRVPDNVQNLGKAPAMEQLTQQLATMLETVGELETTELRRMIHQEWSAALTDVNNFYIQVNQTNRSIAEVLTGQEYPIRTETAVEPESISVELSLFALLNNLNINYQQLGLKAAAMSKFTDTLSDVKNFLSQPATTDAPMQNDLALLFKTNLKRLLTEEIAHRMTMTQAEHAHILNELTEALRKHLLHLTQQLDGCLTQIEQIEQGLNDAKQRNAVLSQRKLEELAAVKRIVTETGMFSRKLSQQLTDLSGA